MEIRKRDFIWDEKTYIMGVLNVTPDSFSDGNLYYDLDDALEHALRMIRYGVDIIDIGGQSTRPGAEEVSLNEELRRVLPVIRGIRQLITTEVPISVDTTKSEVAAQAVAMGADLINDISGGTFDPQMLPTVAQLDVPIVLMHIRGTPSTMQQLTDYQDLIGEIYDFFKARIAAAVAAGINPEKIIIDPGIGFAKTYEQNLEIMRNLFKFRTLNCPILIGVSRKSFIGQILNQPNPEYRVWGTAGACVSAVYQGADIIRVHDVRRVSDACRVADAILRFEDSGVKHQIC